MGPHYAAGSDASFEQVQNSFAEYIRAKMPDLLLGDSSQLLLDTIDTAVSRSTSIGTPRSDAFSPIATPDSSVRSRTPSESHGHDDPLIRVYRRLRDALYKNGLKSRHEPKIAGTESDLHSSDVLARTVGFSISAVEIQQRGVDAQYGTTLLDKIPEATLTHLRVLSESVASYISVGGLRYGGENRIDAELRKASERQHCQLFIREYFGRENENEDSFANIYTPLLSEDPFIFLCECIFGMAVAHNMDIAHLVRTCYLVEIVKVVFHMSRNIPLITWMDANVNHGVGDPAIENFGDFCRIITEIGLTMSIHNVEKQDAFFNEGFEQPGLRNLADYHSFVKKYALTFLRKCAILLHVHFGVDFNAQAAADPDADELTRLTAALRLPSFDEMCTSLTPLGSQCGWPSRTQDLVTGWIRHQTAYADDSESSDRAVETSLPKSALLSHPGIFELVGLPKHYDTLIDECAKRRCPTTGRDLVDPVICLLCGDIFCSQTVCCQQTCIVEDGKPPKAVGGCNQHRMFKCQKNIGLFLNIRKCMVYYSNRLSGSFSHAPYIDKYGEVDVGLRHGRQLFLNQKRYDSMIRNVWLSHGIPSFISRKLESEINNGGWETI